MLYEIRIVNGKNVYEIQGNYRTEEGARRRLANVRALLKGSAAQAYLYCDDWPRPIKRLKG